MLNANATAFVPKPAQVPVSDAPIPAPTSEAPKETPKETSKETAGSSVAADPPATDDGSSDAFDADFEEVLNALDELQESQINQEVEEQMIQELELYESEYDEFIDDDECTEAASHSTNAPPQHFVSHSHHQHSSSGASAKQCKFAPTCRDGARRCRFSHQHMGYCKFGPGCHNPACNFMH